MGDSMFDLTGSVGLVTGGNGGLGLAFARGLARQGAHIVIWGRDAAKNDRARAEIEGFGVHVLAQTVDVTSEAAVSDGFDAALAHFGRLDCVVANAGYAQVTPTIEMASDIWHGLLNTNLHGAFYTLREAARRMVARAQAGEKGGSLIICGSGAVFSGVPGLAHYAASKSGLAGVMRVMAVELAPHQIRVNMIAPGYFATDIGGGDNSETVAMFASRTPLQRAGDPAELEGAVAYLASNAARYHTGDILNIDGGWLASHF